MKSTLDMDKTSDTLIYINYLKYSIIWSVMRSALEMRYESLMSICIVYKPFLESSVSKQ